jgi:intracellular sulfur oxidation DsrE/DsrF family protein
MVRIAAFVLLWGLCAGAAPLAAPVDYPEQELIEELVARDELPGVLFLIMDDDDEALEWVLPRLLQYSAQLREKWPEMPISVLSHGQEMFGLLQKYATLYPHLHADLKRLVTQYKVTFHVCETFAAMADVAPSEFPDYVDVVPFGPAEIENYRRLDFKVVSVELTW